jgi:hypothetical protein
MIGAEEREVSGGVQTVVVVVVVVEVYRLSKM